MDGSIGGECDGKWYGGVYGWGFSVYDPASKEIRHRPAMMSRAPYSFGNGLLVTGDQKYVDAWRGVVEGVNSNHKTIDGKKMYPRMHGDEGWYDFREEPFDEGLLQVYYWSMDGADRDKVSGSGWLEFLDGKNPGYPVESFEEDIELVRSKMEKVAADTASPDTRMSDDMNSLTPAVTEAMTELMLGGLPTGREGHPLHARIRYFDPERGRAGIPEDVASLVTGLTATDVTFTLVNINQVEGRRVVIQGGGYGEHQIKEYVCNGETVSIDDRSFELSLAPGSGAEIRLVMDRYVNQPTLGFPNGV